MSVPPHFNAELHRLLCQQSDQGSTPDLMRRIETLIVADPQARQQYLAYVQLESAAEHLLASDVPERRTRSQFLEPADAAASLVLFPADESLRETTANSALRPAPAERSIPLSVRRRLSLLVGAAAVLFGGVLLGLWGGGEEPPAAAQTKAVATLVSTQQCRWADHDSSTQLGPGARLQVGRLRLVEGLAELVFDCGAQVILEGPAEFQLTSERSATAWQGRLVAKVPPAATGFTVATPDARIIDHGTEFALQVEQSEATEVHVIAGRVDVEPAAAVPGGAVARELRTGQAVRLDRASQGLPRQVELADKRFVRNVRFGYGLYPPSLISYWSFDETLEGSRAMDRAGSNHGSFEGHIRRVAGLVGEGAAMFTNTTGDFINVGPDFSFTTGITIEALIASTWDGEFDPDAGFEVYPDGGNYDEIFRKEDGDQRVLLSFQHDRIKHIKSVPAVPHGPVLSFGLNIGGEYSELDMPLDGRDGRPTVAEICDGTLHHVVATYDSATGEKAIYVDGRKLFANRFPSGSLIESGGKTSASIGGWYQEWASGTGTSFTAAEPFSGAIDEVAVYRAALSENEVAQHYQRIREGRNYFLDGLPEIDATGVELPAESDPGIPAATDGPVAR
jgi:ferric-dicitrate binding protein FerR (iron transport regulator)